MKTTHSQDLTYKIQCMLQIAIGSFVATVSRTQMPVAKTTRGYEYGAVMKVCPEWVERSVGLHKNHCMFCMKIIRSQLWRFPCQRLPAPALISPLIDYVPRCIALLCLVVCIARWCQIVSSFVPGGCCVALQMLICASVLSWIKPGESFRASLGSVVTLISMKQQMFQKRFSWFCVVGLPIRKQKPLASCAVLTLEFAQLLKPSSPNWINSLEIMDLIGWSIRQLLPT